MNMIHPLRRCPAGVVGLLLSLGFAGASSAARGAEADQPTPGRQMLDMLGDRSGLCVHLGAGDAALAMQLSDGGKYLVHGLGRDAKAIEAGRRQIHERGLAGAVSLEHNALKRLPYADNLVNLLVVDGAAASLHDGELLAEVLRVLRPDGVALVAADVDEKWLRQQLTKTNVDTIQKTTIGSGEWLSFRKPRPSHMDEWTHHQYDATRNSVSKDQVQVPTGLRWLAGPNWPTGHRKQAIARRVASQDRLVYVFDDLLDTAQGPKSQRTLIARDAYNGMLLWKRITSNGAAILIHVQDRVYNVVEEGGPLAALDAASGEVVLTFECDSPQQAFYIDGRVLVQTRGNVCCFDAKTAKLLWDRDGAQDMVAGEDVVYVETAYRSKEGQRMYGIIAHDLDSGRELWTSSTENWPKVPQGAELLLYQDGILVFGDGGNHAISAKDGKYLWSYKYETIGHGGSNRKVVSMNGLLWVHNAKSPGEDGKDSYAWEGLDPQTGKLKKRLPHGGFKHRCMHDAATGRYFLCGSSDFVDYETQEHTTFSGARFSCGSGGVLPANGLVYTFPHGCGCFPMLRGFLGLAAEDDFTAAAESSDPARHTKGPAWPAEVVPPVAETDPAWAMYRADASRSGSTPQPGPAKLKLQWSSALADVQAAAMRAEWDEQNLPRLTSAIAAGGLVYAAVNDTHQLFALDAKTGKQKWMFTAGGRIDCAPTIYGGLCLFGARDGYVYCLRAGDGMLVWRYRAAPHERRILAYGQLESAWPVAGGVLIHDGLAYFVAGRHAVTDGGVHVYAAQPATGEIVWHNNPQEGFDSVPDVLVAEGDFIHMGRWQFDAKTGEDRASRSDRHVSSWKLGLLNNAWYERPLALRKSIQHWATDDFSGQMLAFNEEQIVGFLAVTAVDNSSGAIQGKTELFAKPLDGKGRGWSTDLPLGTQIKGMAMAQRTLYIAGRLSGSDKQSDALRAVSLQDGKTLAEIALAEPPVHDCLSIANGRVYLATQSGKILCLGEQ